MEEIAQVYARALFEVAQDRGDLDQVREQLAQFADAVDQSDLTRASCFARVRANALGSGGNRRCAEVVGSTASPSV